MIAAQLPQYDFLNGGMWGYSPSNYLNLSRAVLAAGVQLDEVVVFIGVDDVNDEAANSADVDSSGAVIRAKPVSYPSSWYARHYMVIPRHFMLGYSILQFIERQLVSHGYYHLTLTRPDVPVFDAESTA